MYAKYALFACSWKKSHTSLILNPPLEVSISHLFFCWPTIIKSPSIPSHPSLIFGTSGDTSSPVLSRPAALSSSALNSSSSQKTEKNPRKHQFRFEKCGKVSSPSFFFKVFFWFITGWRFLSGERNYLYLPEKKTKSQDPKAGFKVVDGIRISLFHTFFLSQF